MNIFASNRAKEEEEQKRFTKLSDESKRLQQKYPDRIPVIVEKPNNVQLPELDKSKFLVPFDLNVSGLIYVIRKRMRLNADQAIFLFIKHNKQYSLPATQALIGEIYKQYGSSFGFIHFEIHTESTFGEFQ